MMDKSIQRQAYVMVEELRYGSTGLTMKATGKMTSLMVVGACSTPVEMFTRVSGKMIELMGKANSYSMVVLPTLETGTMIDNMVKVGKSGLMEMSMKGNTLMG